MDTREFVIFDVGSDIAHFRRQYAVTTALTYAVPPRTALCGLVGAVLGLPKNECLRELTDLDAVFGLQIMEPVRTSHVSINLLDTKGSLDFRPKRVNPHTAMRYEVVHSPRYRVMFSHATLGHRLAHLLGRGESRYTPCLGLAWMIAWFDDVHVMAADRIDGDTKCCRFVSPVRTGELTEAIQWNVKSVYQRIRMPAEMRPDRQVTRYEEYIIDTTGQPLEATLKSYWKLADGRCFSAM